MIAEDEVALWHQQHPEGEEGGDQGGDAAGDANRQPHGAQRELPPGPQKVDGQAGHDPEEDAQTQHQAPLLTRTRGTETGRVVDQAKAPLKPCTAR